MFFRPFRDELGLVADQVRQAKADFPLVLRARIKAWLRYGWLLVISPLVVTMGIPAEGIGLPIAVDAIPEIFMTTLNVTGDMIAAALVSRNQVIADNVLR